MSLIDKVLAWTISKKLTVFLLATYFLKVGILESEQWVKLSLMYLGTQGVIDLYNSIKK